MNDEARRTPIRKLQLDTDALHVESFEVSDLPRRSGTVQAYATEAYNTNCCGTEPPPPSAATCAAPCGTYGAECGVSNRCTAVASCIGCTNED